MNRPYTIRAAIIASGIAIFALLPLPVIAANLIVYFGG